MKIAAFVYNFPHKKTQEGLCRLFVNGFVPELVLAADPVELKFRQSKLRVSPRGLIYDEPSKICSAFHIPYYVVPHGSQEAIELVRSYAIDVGVILGARILPKRIIESFRRGIVNLHPAILPGNRGLDNLKWALIRDLPLGVSAHFIDEHVDLGWLIGQRPCPIYSDDTLVDLTLRLQSIELDMMISSLDAIKLGALTPDVCPRLYGGTKFDAVSDEDDKLMPAYLCLYKQKHCEQ